MIEVSLSGRPLRPVPLKRHNNTETIVNGWFAFDQEDNTLVRMPFMLGKVVSPALSAVTRRQGEGERVHEERRKQSQGSNWSPYSYTPTSPLCKS